MPRAAVSWASVAPDGPVVTTLPRPKAPAASAWAAVLVLPEPAAPDRTVPPVVPAGRAVVDRTAPPVGLPGATVAAVPVAPAAAGPAASGPVVAPFSAGA